MEIQAVEQALGCQTDGRRGEREEWPGGLGAAQHMRNIPQAATGKRVNASSKLPCHLQLEGGEEENVDINVKERKQFT